MFRTLKIARARRDFQPPAGTTHVLEWQPPQLLEPGVRHHSPQGWWDIQPVTAWLAGEPVNDPPSEDGPADRSEHDLRCFVDASFAMTRFEVELEIPGEGVFAAPAYWLTLAV